MTAMYSISGRPLWLYLRSLATTFWEFVHKGATQTAHLVTVLMEDPSVRHTEFSLGTFQLPQ